jgi:sulfur relay protein TusB/DsrH
MEKGGHMNKLCLLITKNPHSPADRERVFGPALLAREKGADVTVYLLGDAVYGAKAGLKESGIKEIISKGAKVCAAARDVRARALKSLEDGVEALEDFDKELVTDMMEDSDRVISW